MKQIVLFGTMLGIVACQSNADVTPVPLTNDIVGTYQTNGFLNYLCLTLPADHMPTVTMQATGRNTLNLTLTQSFPKASIQTITGITLVKQSDQYINLIQANRVIGSVQTSRVFTASGMETQGKLLQLLATTTTFIGYKP